MRSKKSYWFEVSVHLQRMAEDGSNKAVTEIYTVDANSFSEAEKRIQKELSTQIRGGIEVKNINPAPYKEVFFTDDETGEHWYKAKLSFISLDEESGKEKRSNTTYLVQADTFAEALRNVESFMKDESDYVTANICETKIMEVYQR